MFGFCYNVNYDKILKKIKTKFKNNNKTKQRKNTKRTINIKINKVNKSKNQLKRHKDLKQLLRSN